MAFDFKKEYKEFYMPKNKPEIVKIPPMNYVSVRGKGNPNAEGGDYQQAISILYAVAYTLKMSCRTDYKIEGFFEYVVPPLEGFWWQDNIKGIDYSNKDTFNWISVIRLPDFITEKDFEWAVQTANDKKKIDCSPAEFLTIDEGLCVQILHQGSFDSEPATVALMEDYLKEQGYENDINEQLFFGGMLPKEDAISAIQKVKQIHCERGRELEQLLPRLDIYKSDTENEDYAMFWDMTVDFGRGYAQFVANWCDRCVEQIENSKEEKV